MYQKNDALTTTPTTSLSNEVPQYKVTKLVQMGFGREESQVSLAATNGSIEESVQLLSEARDSKDVNVMMGGSPS